MLACQKSVPKAHKLRFHLRIYICIAVHLYYTGASDSKNATVHKKSRHSRRSTPDSEPLNYLRHKARHRGRSVAASFSPVFCPCFPNGAYIYICNYMYTLCRAAMRAGMGLSDVAQVQAQGLGAPRNAALHPHQQKITMLDTPQHKTDIRGGCHAPFPLLWLLC